MNHKSFALIAGTCLVLITAGYLLFLAASWNQYQVDRAAHASRIDELLARIPKGARDDPAANPSES